MDLNKHAFRRRILEHAFSEGALRSAEGFVHENVSHWLECLGEGASPGQWTSPKNVATWCTYLGFDIMGDLTFGRRFNCIGSDENRYVPKLMMDSGKLVNFVSSTSSRIIWGSPRANTCRGLTAWLSALHKFSPAVFQNAADDPDSGGHIRKWPQIR